MTLMQFETMLAKKYFRPIYEAEDAAALALRRHDANAAWRAVDSLGEQLDALERMLDALPNPKHTKGAGNV